MTSLQINCPSMSFGVNIVSLGRKLMIGKRQKCAEPPGGGIFGVVHSTSTERGRGGADFLGACTLKKLLHTGVWQHKTHLLQIHHQQHRSPFAVPQ